MLCKSLWVVYNELQNVKIRVNVIVAVVTG